MPNLTSPVTGSPPGDDWARFEPPGGILVWIIVFLEIITFGAGLGVFLYQRGAEPVLFAQGRDLLNQPLAFANTLILLTGGWFMACGLEELRRGRSTLAIRWMVGAIITGLAFLLLKSIEYTEKIQHGATFGDDAFFTLYFALTGFHFIHVLVALVILAYLALQLKRGRFGQDRFQDVEAGGIFWHLCDLIWLLLFPILYLL